MSDGTECELQAKFTLDVPIEFNAQDVAAQLSSLELVDLIKELDMEANDWEATILLASYFAQQLAQAPADLVARSNDELLASLAAAEAKEDAAKTEKVTK